MDRPSSNRGIGIGCVAGFMIWLVGLGLFWTLLGLWLKSAN